MTQSSADTQLNARRLAFGAGVLGIVVFIAYFQALKLQFVGDDWIFIDLAGRLNLADYLVKYFDPHAQTAWYRPVQGMLIRIGYMFFGVDPMPHHLVNVLIHLATALALFIVASHVLGRWRVGFIAGLLFATFPIAVEGVFRTGVIDPLVALAFVIAIGFWIRHLESEQSRFYWFAFAAFLVALLSKEISVTLPITLFLFDRLFIRKAATLLQLARRYLWFGVVGIFYAPIEYIVTRRSVFVHREGYAVSARLLPNFFDYLSGLAFPWGFFPPASYVWLACVSIVLVYLIIAKKKIALVPVIAGAVMAFLPILPFPEVSFRFLIVSLLGTALLYALAFDWVWQRAPRGWATRVVGWGVLVLIAVIGSAQVTQAALDFGEFGRVSRVTYRNVWQAHPTFPDDTYLYFFYPPVPGPNLSGMFFTRYGTRVTVGATDGGQPARLREHAVAYVYYFDAQGNQKEQRVEKEIVTRAAPEPPLTFTEPIRLDGYELASTRVPRGQAFLLLLYWRARAPIAHDYTVSVRLVDAAGKIVAEYFKEPRLGAAPTSTWRMDELVIDAIQLPIPNDAAPGAYRLEVGLYDPATQQRIGIVDASGQVSAEGMIIEVVWVE